MALEIETPPVRPATVFALPEAWSEQTVPWRHCLPVFGIFLMLVAGSQVWAQGLFVLSVGIALLRKPPRYALSRQIDALSLLAIAVVLLSLLPYVIYRYIPLRWLKQGRWRSQVEQADISGGFFYSFQPLLTLELLMLLLAVLALIALLIHAPLYNAQRWRIALLLATGLGAFGALGLLAGLPDADNALLPGLGWALFPNFATAMAMGSLLAFALCVCAVKERWIGGSVLMAACLFLCGAALLLSGSGLWTWTALAAIFWSMLLILRKRKMHGLIRASAILAFLTAATLVILGHAENSGWILNSESSMERAVRNYDAMTVTMQQSALGVGLGNFKYVFPFYQRRSLAQGQIDSPGNDWLLLAAENGLVGLAVFALLGFALLMASLGKSRRNSAPVRLAAQCALLIFLAGTALETPAHYLGTVLLAIACLHIARPSRGEDKKRTYSPRWLWKTQGAVLAVVGILWVSASVLRGSWQSDIASASGQRLISTGIQEKDIAAALKGARLILRFTPLAWQPYMERGQAHILINRDLPEGKADMERVLTLTPGRSDLPYRLGVLWLPYSKQEAETAFTQALERHSDNPDQLYEAIVTTAATDRYFQHQLARLSRLNSQIRFTYLKGIPQNQFANALAEELREDANLQRFNEDQRRELIERWAIDGNTRNAIRYLEEHPDVVPDTWYLRGLALAKLGDIKAASELFCNNLPQAQIPAILNATTRHGQMPLAGFSLPPLERNLSAPEDGQKLNHLHATALLQEQLQNQQWEQAQQTATRLLADGDNPAYAVYWSAWLYNREGNYRRSWPLIAQYARHYLEKRWEKRAAELRGELVAAPSLSIRAFERWGQIDPQDEDTPKEVAEQ